MKERTAAFRRLRNFGSVPSPETVAKHLSEWHRFSQAEHGYNTDRTRDLRSPGSALEVGIENNAPAFYTPDHAGIVFLLRDLIGDQATMGTGAGWALWERRLCRSS